MKISNHTIKKNIPGILIWTCAFAALYFIHLKNYLLFHALAEIFSIIIGAGIFIVAWNARKYINHNFLLIIGIAYLFIGFLDFLHVLSYKGMTIFHDYDYYANQLWVAARLMEASTLLIGIILVDSKIKIIPGFVLAVYSVITFIFIYFIFFSKTFPECFIAGRGQTTFKVLMEFVINAIIIVSIIVIICFRKKFSPDVFLNILISLVFTVFSEMAFTVYISNYGISNMFGHFAKILSFYFIYLATVRKNIVEPFASIFKELNAQKNDLRIMNEKKSQILSIISHDLRGPFGSIGKLLQFVRNDPVIKSSAEVWEIINEINKTVDGTMHMLENLLYWARAEQNKLQKDFQLYNLKEIVSNSYRALELAFGIKEIKLENNIPDDINIFIDKNTMEIAFTNILSNALKFSHRGSIVTINASADEEGTTIVFKDRGVGFTLPDDIDEQMKMVPGRGTENEKGSGLGLSIIRKFTAENNGKLKINSKKGSGTEVYLFFKHTELIPN